jgi:hypothetical protein
VSNVLSPIHQRAAGDVARFITSDTERILGVTRNQFRYKADSYAPNCYCVRVECSRCGQYVWYVPDEPSELPSRCHHCGKSGVGVDGCRGWVNFPLPSLSKPMKLGQPLVPRAEKVTQVCEWCNKQFTIPKRTKKQRCCSQKCGAQRHKHIKAMEGK